MECFERTSRQALGDDSYDAVREAEGMSDEEANQVALKVTASA